MNKRLLALAVAGALSAGLYGCNSSDSTTATTTTSSSALSVPQGADQSTFMVATDFSVTGYGTNLQGASTTVQAAAATAANAQAFGFHKLVTTGYQDNGETFGWVKDKNDQGLMFPDGSKYICNGTNQGVGSGLDHSSLIQQANGDLRLVAQFECQVGAMYTAGIDQDAATGALSMKSGSLQFVSQAGEFGGYTHCAGMVTPWNTHLGSEEYEPNARSEEATADATGKTGDKYYNATFPFWTGTVDDTQGNSATAGMNPYFYGWVPEVAADGTGFTKHYAMGRFSHELAYVMPDQKTVYLSDDGTNDAIYRFVADTAGDLSAGTLYAAKMTQVSAANGGSFNISWISLGHADDATIRSYVAARKQFSDLFTTYSPNADGTCPSGTATNTEAGLECLAINDVDGQNGVDAVDEMIVSRLETRRYAAMKGATTEFRKSEGITMDPATKTMYFSISSIERGMEDGYSDVKQTDKYDKGGNNDVRLPANVCGGVYAMPMDDQYVAGQMNALIVGKPANYAADSEYAGNGCDVNGIANPDNITFIPGTKTLLIGEDTGKHINNMLWAYDVDTKALKRVLTVPKDAEVTSTDWVSFGNYAYITVVGQHPMAKQDVSADQKETLLGYVGPFVKN